MSDDDVDDELTFDLSEAETQSWESKDRTVATFRMSDKRGLCDMKIYLLLRAKIHQMELDLGFHNENDDQSGPH